MLQGNKISVTWLQPKSVEKRRDMCIGLSLILLHGKHDFRDQAAVKIIEKGEKRGAMSIAPCEHVLLGLYICCSKHWRREREELMVVTEDCG